MSQSASTPTHVVPPVSTFRQDHGRFVRWLLDHLGYQVRDEDGQVVLEIPEGEAAAFDGAEQLTLDLGGPASDATPDAAASGESTDWDSRFGKWLLGQLKAAGPALHTRPRGEPMSVGDIMSRMFAAYEVEGGNTHLAGCELSDHPFVRLSFASDDGQTVHDVFVAPDGSTVGDDLVQQLGLDDVTSIRGDTPPRLDAGALRSLVAAGRRIAVKQASRRDPDATVAEPLAVTVIWIRHADGHLQFTIGESSATQSFSGWAKLLTPPPFVARASGVSTFHLAATDDGRVDAAQEMAHCEQSGKRVLRQDLLECAVTGKLVLPEFTETCPVTGLPALRSEFDLCQHCRQRVCRRAFGESGTSGESGGQQRCLACRQLAKVRKDDPRLVWLLGEHPGLDRWPRWQLAETETVYIAQASSLTKRLLVVVDKETLAVRHLATGGLFGGGWAEVREEAQGELLG